MNRGPAVSYQNFGGQKPERSTQAEHLDALIAKARGRARADGFEDGVAHAEAERDAAADQSLHEIAAALKALQENHDETAKRAAAATMDAVKSFIAAIAPRLLAIGAADAVASALSDGVSRVPAPSIEVEVSEANKVETQRALLKAGVKCMVKGNPDIEPGAARIRRSGGFDEINIQPAIDAALSALALGARSAPRGHQPNENSSEETVQ